MKIGILRETKKPIERRVPLTPEQCRELMSKYPDLEIRIQPSPKRCFPDTAYEENGISVTEDLRDCKILLGIKEVQPEDLLPQKSYFFFSHTAKLQQHNRGLLQSILEKEVTLIDYELIKDFQDRRLISFGRFAGVVGAYWGLLGWGERTGAYKMRDPRPFISWNEIVAELNRVDFPPLRVVLTGRGRVAQGVVALLREAGFWQVDKDTFLTNPPDQPVFTQLAPSDFLYQENGIPAPVKRYKYDPSGLVAYFGPYLKQADMLITGTFWDPRGPVLFKREALLNSNSRLKFISDISCDLEGPIPTTLQCSTVADPFYDYSVDRGGVEPPFSSERNVTVMAVDNLPAIIPHEASVSFGQQLIKHLFPLLMEEDPHHLLFRATIAHKGYLTPRYKYLEGFVYGWKCREGVSGV